MLRGSERLRRRARASVDLSEHSVSSVSRVWRLPASLWLPVGCLPLAVSRSHLKNAKIDFVAPPTSSEDRTEGCIWLGYRLKREGEQSSSSQANGTAVSSGGRSHSPQPPRSVSRSSSPGARDSEEEETPGDRTCFDVLLSLCGATNAAWEARLEAAWWSRDEEEKRSSSQGQREDATGTASQTTAKRTETVQLIFSVWINISPFLMKRTNAASQFAPNEFLASASEIFLLQHLLPLRTLSRLRLPLKPVFASSSAQTMPPSSSLSSSSSSSSASSLSSASSPLAVLGATRGDEWEVYAGFVRTVFAAGREGGEKGARLVASCGGLMCSRHFPSPPASLSLQSAYDLVSESAWRLQVDEPPPHSLLHFLASSLTKNANSTFPTRDTRQQEKTSGASSASLFRCKCGICRLTHEALHMLLAFLDPASLAAFGTTNRSHFLLAEPVVPGLQLMVGDCFLHPYAQPPRESMAAASAPPHLLDLPPSKAPDPEATLAREESRNLFLGGLFTHQTHGLLWLRHRERRVAAQAPPFCFCMHPAKRPRHLHADRSAASPACVASVPAAESPPGSQADFEAGEDRDRRDEERESIEQRDVLSGECRLADDALKFLAKWTELQLPHHAWLTGSAGPRQAAAWGDVSRRADAANSQDSDTSRGAAGYMHAGQDSVEERCESARTETTTSASRHSVNAGHVELRGESRTGEKGVERRRSAGADEALKGKDAYDKDEKSGRVKSDDARERTPAETGEPVELCLEEKADKETPGALAGYSYRLLLSETASLACLAAPHPSEFQDWKPHLGAPEASSSAEFSSFPSHASDACTGEKTTHYASEKADFSAAFPASRLAEREEEADRGSEGFYFLPPHFALPQTDTGAFSLYFNSDTRLCAIGFSRKHRNAKTHRASVPSSFASSTSSSFSLSSSSAYSVSVPSSASGSSFSSSSEVSPLSPSLGGDTQSLVSIRGWTQGTRGGGGLFCDDPGLGKTLAMLSVMVKSMGRLPTVARPVKEWMAGYLARLHAGRRQPSQRPRERPEADDAAEDRDERDSGKGDNGGGDENELDGKEGDRSGGDSNDEDKEKGRNSNWPTEKRDKRGQKREKTQGLDDAETDSQCYVWKFAANEINSYFREQGVRSAFSYPQLNPLLSEAEAGVSPADGSVAFLDLPKGSGGSCPSLSRHSSGSLGEEKPLSRFGRTKFLVGYSLPPAESLPSELRELTLDGTDPGAETFRQTACIRDVATQLASRQLLSEADLHESSQQAEKLMQKMKRIYHQLSSTLSTRHGDPNALLRSLVNREVSDQIATDERARRLHANLASPPSRERRIDEEGTEEEAHVVERQEQVEEPSGRTTVRGADEGETLRRQQGGGTVMALNLEGEDTRDAGGIETHASGTSQSSADPTTCSPCAEHGEERAAEAEGSRHEEGKCKDSQYVRRATEGERLLDGRGGGKKQKRREDLACDTKDFFSKQDIELFRLLPVTRPQDIPSQKPPEFLLSHGTLLVCPTPLVNHWSSEVKKWFSWSHCNDVDRLKVLVLERRDRAHAVPLPTRAELASCHLVICSQHFLTAEFQRCLASVWAQGQAPERSLSGSKKRRTDTDPRLAQTSGKVLQLPKQSRRLATPQEVEEAMWGRDVAGTPRFSVHADSRSSGSPFLSQDRRGETEAFGDDAPAASGALLARLLHEVGAGAGLSKGHVGERFCRSRSPLLSIHWQRLVVDEGHSLSRCTAQYVQLCRMIVADKRWVLTGTPTSRQSLRHSLTGLTALLEFLRHPFALPYRHCGVSATKTSPLKAAICRPLLERGEASALFQLALLLNTCLVRHSKEQCQRLPALRGPTIYRIEPSAKERTTYNDLVQLMQRNLFCTYYSRKNKDSLLHPSQRAQASTSLWNLRFSCTIQSESHLHILTKWVDEAVEMLANKHAVYHNEFPYKFQFERIAYVVEVYLRLNKVERTYATCDMCRQAIRFPLLVPCPSLHLLCTECLFPQIFSDNLCRRPPLRHCPLCWPHAPINADFFDRLQPPVEHNTTFDWPFKVTRGARANAELDRRSLIFRNQQSARRDRQEGGNREDVPDRGLGGSRGSPRGAGGLFSGCMQSDELNASRRDDGETLVMEVETYRACVGAVGGPLSPQGAEAVFAASHARSAGVCPEDTSEERPSKNALDTAARRRADQRGQTRLSEVASGPRDEGGLPNLLPAHLPGSTLAPRLVEKVKEKRTFRASAETLRIVRRWFPQDEHSRQLRDDAFAFLGKDDFSPSASTASCAEAGSPQGTPRLRPTPEIVGGSEKTNSGRGGHAVVFGGSLAAIATPKVSPLSCSCKSDVATPGVSSAAAPTLTHDPRMNSARFTRGALGGLGVIASAGGSEGRSEAGVRQGDKGDQGGRLTYPRYVDVEDAFAYDFNEKDDGGETKNVLSPFSNRRPGTSPSASRAPHSSPRKGHLSWRTPASLSSLSFSSTFSPITSAFAHPSSFRALGECVSSQRSRSESFASSTFPSSSGNEGTWRTACGPRGAALAARREATLLSLLLSGGISTREILEEFDDAEIDEEDAIFFSSSKNALVVRRILHIIYSGDFAQNNIPESLLEPRQRPAIDGASQAAGAFPGLSSLDMNSQEQLSEKYRFPNNDTCDESDGGPLATPKKKVCFADASLYSSSSSSSSLSPSSSSLSSSSSSDGRARFASPKAELGGGAAIDTWTGKKAAKERKTCGRGKPEAAAASEPRGVEVHTNPNSLLSSEASCATQVKAMCGSLPVSSSPSVAGTRNGQGEQSEAGFGNRGILKKRGRDETAASLRGTDRLIKRCPKIIVASSLWENLFLLGCFLEKHSVKCCHFYEKMQDKTNRVEALKSFQQDTETMVLLLSTQLGAHGLDLSCASHVLLPDPPTDPNVEQQVISRAHRMGALRDVHVEIFILKDTVEETILQRRGVWTASPPSDAGPDGKAYKDTSGCPYNKQSFVFGTRFPREARRDRQAAFATEQTDAEEHMSPTAEFVGETDGRRLSGKKGKSPRTCGPEGTHTHLRKRGQKASFQGDACTTDRRGVAGVGAAPASEDETSLNTSRDGSQSPSPVSWGSERVAGSSRVGGSMRAQPNWREIHDEAVGLGEGLQKQTEYLLRTLRTIRRPACAE